MSLVCLSFLLFATIFTTSAFVRAFFYKDAYGFMVSFVFAFFTAYVWLFKCNIEAIK